MPENHPMLVHYTIVQMYNSARESANLGRGLQIKLKIRRCYRLPYAVVRWNVNNAVHNQIIRPVWYGIKFYRAVPARHNRFARWDIGTAK